MGLLIPEVNEPGHACSEEIECFSAAQTIKDEFKPIDFYFE